MTPTLLLHCTPTFTFDFPTVVRYGGSFLSVELPSPVKDHKSPDHILAQIDDETFTSTAFSFQQTFLNQLVQCLAIILIFHFSEFIVS